MKKWIFLLGIMVVFGLISLLGVFYHSIFSKQEVLEAQAVELIRENTDISVFEDVDYYHGSSPYHVVWGKTKSGESVVAWINEETKTITIKAKEHGVTKEEVRNHVINERSPIRIESIHLGMEDDQPLWEVIYIDENRRLNYYYIHFETGEFLKRYSLQKDVYKEAF